MYSESQRSPDNNKSTTITGVYRTYKKTNNGRQQHGCGSSTEEHTK